MLRLEQLASLYEKHRDAAKVQVTEFSLGGRLFAFNSRPFLMGVINLSADSWYRESVCLSAESAVERGRVLAAQGADIIDLGAESTLAHAARRNASEQESQLLPVLRSLRQAGILVSVETYDEAVADAALTAGANILNLTSSEPRDELYRKVAAHEAAVIICYVQGRNVREVCDYQFAADPIGVMSDYFRRRVEHAMKCGVQKILIDPGLGFYYRNLQDSADRVRFQMDIFLNSFRLRSLGVPICHALPHAFEFFGDEVRSAEPFFAVLASLGRTDLFRTHEVSRTRAVLRTLALYPE